ncbi:hypothetical protein IW262DRAFT_1291276 [Armillaria fumosa]|nr:hypothetical protein IW262DRAFT_1291276 [Armillaria fumosa]
MSLAIVLVLFVISTDTRIHCLMVWETAIRIKGRMKEMLSSPTMHSIISLILAIYGYQYAPENSPLRNEKKQSLREKSKESWTSITAAGAVKRAECRSRILNLYEYTRGSGMLQGVILARCAYLGDQGSGTDVDESSSVIRQGQGDQGSLLRLEFVVKLLRVANCGTIAALSPFHASTMGPGTSSVRFFSCPYCAAKNGQCLSLFLADLPPLETRMLVGGFTFSPAMQIKIKSLRFPLDYLLQGKGCDSHLMARVPERAHGYQSLGGSGLTSKW